MACRLHRRPDMDATEFDRLVTRAQDPRLIPGIYSYCDSRCPRCPFTERCLTYLDNQELQTAGGGDQSLADTVGDSLQRTLEMLAEVARREGVDLDALLETGRWVQSQLGRAVPGMLLKAGRFPKTKSGEAAQVASLPSASNPRPQVRA